MGAEDECWLWQGRVDRDGYGEIKNQKRRFRAHRVAYELMVGPIPEGLVIDHLCRVRHCVNPAHMEPVTNAENVRRGDVGKWWRAVVRDTCVNGHPWTPENRRMRSNGYTDCIPCARERHAAWVQRQAS